MLVVSQLIIDPWTTISRTVVVKRKFKQIHDVEILACKLSGRLLAKFFFVRNVLKARNLPSHVLRKFLSTLVAIFHEISLSLSTRLPSLFPTPKSISTSGISFFSSLREGS